MVSIVTFYRLIHTEIESIGCWIITKAQGNLVKLFRHKVDAPRLPYRLQTRSLFWVTQAFRQGTSQRLILAFFFLSFFIDSSHL